MKIWLAVWTACIACHAPAAPPPSPCPPTMKATDTPAQTLAQQAARQVLAGLPAGAGYPLLLQVGDGVLAGQAGQALRAALACDARIVFASVRHEPLAPVPDASTAAGHVNAVADTVQPWPRLVLRVSESAGILYIAAREPGSDPLGPPDAGWLWVLQRP